MTANDASFLIADNLDEALAAMNNGATPIAGGTDLVVEARQSKERLSTPLVAVDRIPELQSIAPTGNGGLSVGAGVTHAVLMTSPLIVDKFTALADAAALIGSPATRNVGTLGGNVMNGSPAMDTGAPLAVLNATVELASSEGARSVATDELWVGPGITSAEANELCVALVLPKQLDHSGSAYVRLEYRRAMEIAVVGAAARVTLNPDQTMADCSVALTAVAPTIVAVTGLESVTDRPLDSKTLETVSSLASLQASPISDLRASDHYRSHCVGVIAKRALIAACRRAAGESIPVPVNRSIGIGADAGSNEPWETSVS